MLPELALFVELIFSSAIFELNQVYTLKLYTIVSRAKNRTKRIIRQFCMAELCASINSKNMNQSYQIHPLLISYNCCSLILSSYFWRNNESSILGILGFIRLIHWFAGMMHRMIYEILLIHQVIKTIIKCASYFDINNKPHNKYPFLPHS